MANTNLCSIPKCKEPSHNSWSIQASLGGLTAKAKAAGIKNKSSQRLCDEHNEMVRAIANALGDFGPHPYVYVFFHSKGKPTHCAVPKCKGKSEYPLKRGKTQLVWVCSKDLRPIQRMQILVSITAALRQLGKWKQQPFCGYCGDQRCYICLGCRICNPPEVPKCTHLCPNGHVLVGGTFTCTVCKKSLCKKCTTTYCALCNKCTKCDVKCPKCGKCDKNCSCYGESDVALGTWGLPASLNLRAAASRFYVLMEKSVVDVSFRPALDEYAKELAGVFANYLDMAIGGEIRYGSVDNEGVQELLPRIVERYTERSARISRGRAWHEWKELRDDYGISILKEAETALFDGEWNGNLGGPMWGQCAKTLRLYEEGELSDVLFVDQAFSLEHNNGCVFNKLWTTSGMGDLLHTVFKGDLKDIILHLPYKERNAYMKWRESRDESPSG